MADTSTSGDMSREESEAANRAMRAGKDPNSDDKPKKKGKKTHFADFDLADRGGRWGRL